jgi:hypothetical protein
MTIKIKSNKRLAREDIIFRRGGGGKTVFPYSPRPQYFIRPIVEAAPLEAFINYMVLPRIFSIHRIKGRTRIVINIWPLFTIFIKI